MVIVIPAQTMPLAVLSFSSIQNNASQFFSTMKETIRKHKTVVAVAVGSCIATCACAFRLKNQKTTSAVALGGFIATGLSKIYCNWKKTTNIQPIEGIRARVNQEEQARRNSGSIQPFPQDSKQLTFPLEVHDEQGLQKLVQDETGVRVPNDVESQSFFRSLLSRLRQGVEETFRLLEE